jgi:hypothetical protein
MAQLKKILCNTSWSLIGAWRNSPMRLNISIGWVMLVGGALAIFIPLK